jgi:putative glutamine amidotransferase
MPNPERHPLVAVTATSETTAGRERVRLNAAYTQALERAGLVPIVIPPLADPAAAAAVLAAVRGLVLTGGEDVDPARYGAPAHPELGAVQAARDATEIALAHAARALALPTLAICRGIQLLNVALGGTLVQHLPEAAGTESHRTLAGTFSEHHVRLDPESLACAAAGVEGFVVWSHHHQGVDQLGEGLVAVGWTDDTVEAIELPDKRFALGVLWHPEEDERSNVVGALVEAARLR